MATTEYVFGFDGPGFDKREEEAPTPAPEEEAAPAGTEAAPAPATSPEPVSAVDVGEILTKM